MSLKVSEIVTLSRDRYKWQMNNSASEKLILIFDKITTLTQSEC